MLHNIVWGSLLSEETCDEEGRDVTVWDPNCPFGGQSESFVVGCIDEGLASTKTTSSNQFMKIPTKRIVIPAMKLPCILFHRIEDRSTRKQKKKNKDCVCVVRSVTSHAGQGDDTQTINNFLHVCSTKTLFFFLFIFVFIRSLQCRSTTSSGTFVGLTKSAMAPVSHAHEQHFT